MGQLEVDMVDADRCKCYKVGYRECLKMEKECKLYKT